MSQVLSLPQKFLKVMGLGAHLKASVCLIDGDTAYLSENVGDMGALESVETYEHELSEMIDQAGGIDQLATVAHDLHPNFHTTVTAERLGCKTLAVQHHHAHILATTIEHHHRGPVLGLALDGYGMGAHQDAWGGELLWVDGLDFKRLGHLTQLAQPGGDVAAREPWRMAAAALHALDRADEITVRFADQPHAALLKQMLAQNINSPLTSSCGRLFDAACGLLGVRPVCDFEGQAPMELEAMATAPVVVEGGWHLHKNGTLNLRPLLAALTEMTAQQGANAFHGTLATALSDWVKRAVHDTGVTTVAFGGGCFLNQVLADILSKNLKNDGVEVLKPQRFSPTDAALSLGQAYAAALSAQRME